MRTGFAHLTTAFLLTIGLTFFSFGTAEAGFKIKASVERFHNPPDWKEPFDPGVLVEKILKKAIGREQNFRLVSELDQMPPKSEPAPTAREKTANGTQTGGKENGKAMAPMQSKPSAQMWIQGKVLTFNPNSAGMSSESNGKGGRVPEIAVVEVELQIHNARTQKTVAEKRFRVSSKEGKSPFDPAHADFDDPAFRRTSLNVALELFGGDAVLFINSATDGLPFLADIIFVDGKKEEVIVNAGANDGVEFRDQFPIYSLRLNYTDPASHVDLGEFYTQLGAVKIKEVRDNYSRAEIIAGADIREGALAMGQRSKAEAKPWWDYHGILALTNDYPVMLEEYQNGGPPEP